MGKHLLPRALLFIWQCFRIASILGRCTSVCGCRNACNGWSLTSKNASNGTCHPRKMLPILLAMATAGIQYWRRRRRAGSKIASDRGSGPQKLLQMVQASFQNCFQYCLQWKKLGFQNGKNCFKCPKQFPMLSREDGCYITRYCGTSHEILQPVKWS